jgi:hypothetical protein
MPVVYDNLPFGSQEGDGPADGVAGDGELLHQAPLGRQWLTGPDPTICDLFSQVAGDLPEQRVA